MHSFLFPCQPAIACMTHFNTKGSIVPADIFFLLDYSMLPVVLKGYMLYF